MTPEQINELDRLRWLRDELTAWLEAHEKVIAQQAGEIERLTARVAELRSACQELRIRLHAAGRRPEECYEMSLIDATLAPAGEGS